MTTRTLQTLQGHKQVVHLDAERLYKPYCKQALFGEAENQLSPNAFRTEQVYNKFTDIHDNGQQDYTLLANKDVATKLL